MIRVRIILYDHCWFVARIWMIFSSACALRFDEIATYGIVFCMYWTRIGLKFVVLDIYLTRGCPLPSWKYRQVNIIGSYLILRRFLKFIVNFDDLPSLYETILVLLTPSVSLIGLSILFKLRGRVFDAKLTSRVIVGPREIEETSTLHIHLGYCPRLPLLFIFFLLRNVS